MATLLGKSSSFCSSCVLSEKCFVVFYVFSFPPGVYVGTSNLIAPTKPEVGKSTLLLTIRYLYQVRTVSERCQKMGSEHNCNNNP